MKRIMICLVVGLGMILGATPASATDGYFSIGYGPYHKSLAGGGLAWYRTSLISGNPAGNAFLGQEYMVSMGLFNPTRSYTVTGNPSMTPNSFGLTPGKVESESNFFPLPAIGANWLVGENSAVGAAIYAHGGMNTDYPTATFHDPSSESTGVNLSQLFAELTYAYKFSDNHSIGLSAVAAYQMFEAKGLNTFAPASADAQNLSNNDVANSIGFGFKVGYQGEITNGLFLGAMYQSEMAMSEFDEYAGLFAEQGDFDIPAAWSVGLAFEVSETFTVMADYKQILYSGVNAVSNVLDPMVLFPGFIDENGDPQQNPNWVPMGTENGAGFGWEDMGVVKLGAEFTGVENWSFRAGYSYGDQPVPEKEVLFNILAPGVIKNHITLGGSRALGQNGSQLHFSIHYALNNTVTGINPLDPVQTIDIELQEFEFDVAVSF